MVFFSCQGFSQLHYKESLDLGTIEKAYMISGDIILTNNGEETVHLLRASSGDAKVFTSKRSIPAGDTALLTISFIPSRKGTFRKDIALFTGDMAEPLEMHVKGTLREIITDDKTACYYFGSPKRRHVSSSPVMVSQQQTYTDNSNKIPDPFVSSGPRLVTRTVSPRPQAIVTKTVAGNPALLSATGYKPNNVLFLIDISGSMKDSLKLPLMKKAIHQLIDAVRDNDSISLVTYADSVKLRAESISGSEKTKLHEIVNGLSAKGMTKGKRAIFFSQDLVQKHYLRQGNNQIIIASDGIFRFVPEDQKLWSQRQAGKEVIISAVAFGNDPDALKNLRQIARKGDGSFMHIRSSTDTSEVLEEIKLRSRVNN